MAASRREKTRPCAVPKARYRGAERKKLPALSNSRQRAQSRQIRCRAQPLSCGSAGPREPPLALAHAHLFDPPAIGRRLRHDGFEYLGRVDDVAPRRVPKLAFLGLDRAFGMAHAAWIEGMDDSFAFSRSLLVAIILRIAAVL